MMNFKYAIPALLMATVATSALAQTTGTQKFTVTVPSAMSIVAPAAVSLVHDESEDDQIFPAQQWIVRGNSLAGVTVSFATDSEFKHATDVAGRRDAKIDLALASTVGGAAWTVNQASDQTDFANNDGVATVQATSNGFGRANMDVTVTFVTDGFGSFPAGVYETTVTGTVAAN